MKKSFSTIKSARSVKSAKAAFDNYDPLSVIN
jgi:hypothetical protein